MLTQTTKKAISTQSHHQSSDGPSKELESLAQTADRKESIDTSQVEQLWKSGLRGNDVFIKAHSKSLLERFGSAEWKEGEHPLCWTAFPVIGGAILAVGGAALGMIGTGISSLTGFSALNLGLNGLWLGAAGALAPAASVVKVIAAGFAAIDRKWIRKTKVTEEVSQDEIKSVLRAFDEATPHGQAFMALRFDKWKESLSEEGSLLPGAETQLSERIARAARLPESVRSSAQRIHQLFNALHGLKSEKEPVPEDLEEIRRALKALKDEERESLMPLLSQIFFLDTRPGSPWMRPSVRPWLRISTAKEASRP